uniref:Uncharacterized protein n=1 Tax=Anopheles christyi TaxID=43041 RepID=A0A182KHR7_9DIPT
MAAPPIASTLMAFVRNEQWPRSTRAMFPSNSSAFSNIDEHASAGMAGTSFPCGDLYEMPNVPPKSFAGLNRYVYSNAEGSRISKNTSPAIMSCVRTPSFM